VRVAAISDIHGNLPALETAAEAIRALGAPVERLLSILVDPPGAEETTAHFESLHGA